MFVRDTKFTTRGTTVIHDASHPHHRPFHSAILPVVQISLCLKTNIFPVRQASRLSEPTLTAGRSTANHTDPDHSTWPVPTLSTGSLIILDISLILKSKFFNDDVLKYTTAGGKGDEQTHRIAEDIHTGMGGY